jgi:sugar O-acyltransferase (sialic acid O-acetyltransferase NeuD family)
VKRLALLGASGHGKVVADIASALGFTEVLFFDDAWPNSIVNGRWPVVGNTSMLIDRLNEFDGVVVAIGNCSTRWKKQEELLEAGAVLVTLIHPKAHVSPFASFGKGTVVMPGAVVNTDANVGDACIINSGATVDHDCALGHGVHIGPGAHLSGNVIVGACTWIGVGSSIRQATRIGSNVMVGAGAVVLKNVGDEQTMIGNPAVPLIKAKA